MHVLRITHEKRMFSFHNNSCYHRVRVAREYHAARAGGGPKMHAALRIQGESYIEVHAR
jgi:hypothetical protein